MRTLKCDKKIMTRNTLYRDTTTKKTKNTWTQQQKKQDQKLFVCFVSYKKEASGDECLCKPEQLCCNVKGEEDLHTQSTVVAFV